MTDDLLAAPTTSPAVTAPAPRHDARDVAAAALGSTATALSVFLVGSLAVQIGRSIDLNVSALGAAVSLCYLASAAAAVPSGRLADHIGGARTMRLAAGLAAVSTALVAALAGSFVTLVAFLMLAGVASAAMQPATNLLLVRRIPERRQGLAFGIKQSAVPLATLLGGLAVPGIGLTIGWRWAFAGAAGVAVLAVALSPRSRGSLAAHRRSRSAPRGKPEPLGPLLVLSVGFALGVFAATGLTTFLVVAAVAAGLSRAGAGLVAALAGAAAVSVRIAAGARADRRGHSHLRVVAGMLACGTAGYLALAAGSALRIPLLFVVGAVVTFGAGWGWNGLFNFAVTRSHLRAPARATGITQAGNRLAGVMGPLSFGLVATHTGYAVAWIMCAGVVLAAALVVLAGRRMLRARRLEPLPADAAP